MNQLNKEKEALMKEAKNVALNDALYANTVVVAKSVGQASIAFIRIKSNDKEIEGCVRGVNKDELADLYSSDWWKFQPQEFVILGEKDVFFNTQNALTLQRKKVVSYAGFPLKNAEKQIIGVLAVLDFESLSFTNKQQEIIQNLASQLEEVVDKQQKIEVYEKAMQELKRHNKLLRNFAGAVSHDLKMPLANIIVTIDVLKRKYGEQLDEQAIAYLNKLKQSSFGMSDYISNILAYYETENVSSEDYSEKPFDLKSFLEGIIDMLNIEREYTINLPENNVDLVCNHSGLEQIFLNLLGNSLKYNDKSKPVISIKCKTTDDFYTFSITDNGMGIPEGDLEQIFNLFSVATDKDRHGKRGHGIGLSTVQKLVQKLGGEIEVSSELGKYTTFVFSIKKQAISRA